VEGEIVLLDGQDSYLRVKDNFYNISDLISLLNHTEFYGLPGQETLDGPTKHVPFKINLPYITSGFVKVNGDYNLPPHEDNFLASQLEPYRDKLGNQYIEWLEKTGNRKCALMIPVKGDFANTNTDMYRKDTKEKVTSFTLKDGPVLFKTRGDVMHGVNNIGKGDRVTFQLSFGEEYEFIKDKIFAFGLAKV